MRLKQFLKYNAKTVFFNVMKTQFVIAGGIYVIVFFFSILINTGENNGMHASFSNMFNIILFVSGLTMFNMIYDEIYKVSVANSVSRLTTVAATIVTALGSSLFTALLISICERFM